VTTVLVSRTDIDRGVDIDRMKTILLTALILLASCTAAGAQVLTTAETLGAGKQAVLASENRVLVDGARLHMIVGQYVRGLSNHFDLYLAAGVTRTDEDTGTRVLNQAWLGAGGNWNFAQWKGFRASFFGILSIPVTRRGQASKVLANPALVISRTLVRNRLVAYTGVNALVPIGHRDLEWFTPSKTQVNVPVGALVMLGKWGVFAEADIGHLKAAGLGLARTF
jgi:hypothetical protein